MRKTGPQEAVQCQQRRKQVKPAEQVARQREKWRCLGVISLSAGLFDDGGQVSLRLAAAPGAQYGEGSAEEGQSTDSQAGIDFRSRVGVWAGGRRRWFVAPAIVIPSMGEGGQRESRSESKHGVFQQVGHSFL